MNEGKVAGALFIDLKKAFDTVNHTIVLQKLASYGVNGNTLSWFSSYLSGRSQTVSVNSTLSDFKDNRDFAFFVFERTKHQPRRHLRSHYSLAKTLQRSGT